MFGLDMVVRDDSALTPLNGFLAGILLAIEPGTIGDVDASYRIEIDGQLLLARCCALRSGAFRSRCVAM